MFTKFTLIGLPGVGKSTTTKECAEIIRSKGFVCTIQSTDEIIRLRFKEDDPIIRKFEEMIGKKIPVEVFKAEKPSSVFMKIFGEEPLFRDLEEMFIKDIIASAKSDHLYDLGGKAPLRNGSIVALQKMYIVPIFLFASHETILDRLSSEDNWKKRSNYLNEGIHRWKQLAENHRTERLAKYFKCAPIVISVEDYTKKSEGEIQKEAVYLKSPEELAREIFYRVGELKRICSDRTNTFTQINMAFFKQSKTDPLNLEINKDLSSAVQCRFLI